MQTKESKPSGFLLFTVFAIACILIAFVATIVFGDSCTALSCGTIKGETVVANSEYIWTTDDQIGKLIREAKIVPEPVVRDFRTTEKEQIVADVTHKEEKRKEYKVRVGLEGERKPIPNLSGSKDERAKQLLDTVGIGYTLPIWKSLGEKYKIDYTLPIAIGFADSHLGKALKSKNNIGNIGNNDSGHTRDFDSLEAGIEAIFWSLAHGKYMSGHNIIGTLSGEGRKRLGLPGCNEEKDYKKKCYASSLGVWSTNVVNAMSAMNGKQIDENYEFRLK